MGVSRPSTPASVRTDTGTLPGDHPYVEVGDGPRALVVLPGFEDAMFPGAYPPFSGLALVPYFARYLGEYTVYLLSRPRGLPPGYGPDDAVSTHARALGAIADSTVGIDAIGISMAAKSGRRSRGGSPTCSIASSSRTAGVA